MKRSHSCSHDLDRTDLRILQQLQQYGRISNKELAESVHLSASACHERTQRLLESGWIIGFQCQVDIERLCEPVMCIATISLNDHAPERFRFLEQCIQNMPEAISAYTVSGSCDLIVHFACRQMSRYMNLTNDLIQTVPEIGHINTHVVLKQSKPFSGYPLEELLPGLLKSR